jgi:hypothetical protein
MGVTDLCDSDADCNDGLFCNGPEVCDQGSCSGLPPGPVLDDGVACTVDTCNEETNQVEHTPNHNVCSDGSCGNGVEYCDYQDGCSPGSGPSYIHNNGNFDGVDGFSTQSWVEDGVIDEYVFDGETTTCGFEFTGYTFVAGLAQFATTRIRIYDLSNGFDAQFSSTEPILDGTFSTGAGTLAHVDTGVDGFGMDLVRFVVSGIEWNLPAGVYGMHITFPSWTTELFYLATAPQTGTGQCMHFWGSGSYEDAFDLCGTWGGEAENGDFKVVGVDY